MVGLEWQGVRVVKEGVSGGRVSGRGRGGEARAGVTRLMIRFLPVSSHQQTSCGKKKTKEVEA